MPITATPVYHELIQRLLTEQGWVQFADHVLGDDGMPVFTIVGRITAISVDPTTGRLVCACPKTFIKNNNGPWELQNHTEPFLVPGLANQHVPEICKDGSIALFASNVEDQSVTFFLREDTKSKHDLDEIEKNAVPERRYNRDDDDDSEHQPSSQSSSAAGDFDTDPDGDIPF